MPVYNVAPFLDEALESIRSQDEANLQIICVDDGSTDGSADILAHHAALDERILVHRQDNAGLGAARNKGLSLSTGEYIMFVDSDDRLADGAVRALADSLDQSISDLAVGKVRRFDETRTWRSALTTSAFNFRLDRTHISETPQLVYDTVAVNKAYRRSFLDRIGFEFPTGVAFEDMALIARTHVEATAVDVVPVWVYEWRERSGSITANRFDPASFRDRITALGQIRSLFAVDDLEQVIEAFLMKLVDFDQMIYARALDVDDPGQVQQFVDGYRSLYKLWPVEAIRASDAPLPRAIALAIRSGDAQRVAALARLTQPSPGPKSFAAVAGSHPAISMRSGAKAGVKRSQELAKPALGKLASVRKEATPVALQAAGKVLSATTEHPRTNPLREHLRDPLGVALRTVRTRSLVRGKKDATVRRATFDTPGGRRVWTRYNSGGWLRVQTHAVPTLVTPHSLDDVAAEVTVSGQDGQGPFRLRASRSGRLISGDQVRPGAWRFPLAKAPSGTEVHWVVEHRLDGRWHPADGKLEAPPLRYSGAERTYVFEVSPAGRVTLGVQPTRPLVSASIDDDLRVTIDAQPDLEGVRLRHGSLKIDFPAEQLDDGSWSLALRNLTRFGTAVPLRVGTWAIHAKRAGRWEASGTVLPAEREWSDPEAGTVLHLRFTESSMRITVANNYAPDERGKWNQAALNQAVPRQMRHSPTRRSVVYECFYGKQVSCHPRAMLGELQHELSDWEHLWVINPGMNYAPPGTTPLIRWSREWYRRMADSKIIVTNCGLATHFRRRDDQVVLQTWHGTPLKRIGLDMITFANFRGGYVRETQIQSQQWTHMISPNPFCSGVFPEAFAFENELLEIGSPRNDQLVAQDPDVVAAIRSRLGLLPGQRAVLVAPTWRDNQRGRQGWQATLGFDPEKLLEALPDDVVVLFRAHSNIGSIAKLVELPRFINVTDYPDIQDLYLVADALSTDYSSVMFDYATLNRPIVFFCPDLEEYRDELRGFYFDFQAEAPGPIVRREHDFGPELARVLTDGLNDAEQERFAAFRHRYTSLEDGKATGRAVTAILDAAGVDPIG